MAAHGPSAGEDAATGGGGEFDSIVFGSYKQIKPVPLDKKDDFPLGADGWKAAFDVYLKNCDHPALQEEIYFQDDDFMVIYDGYPKARHHLLLLPKPSYLDVRGPSDLRDVHLPKLCRLHALGKALVKNLARQGAWEVRCGYHAFPSMKPLHLHIISQDFDSPSLRKKRHWNVFTTGIFMAPGSVEEELGKRGRLEIDHEKCNRLKEQTLRCHVCGEKISSMTSLKEHYRSHIIEAQDARMIDAGQSHTTSQDHPEPQQEEPGEPGQPAADPDGAGGSQPVEGQTKKERRHKKRAKRKPTGGKWTTKKGKGKAVEKASGEDGVRDKNPVETISGGLKVSDREVPEEVRYAEPQGQEATSGQGSEGGAQRQRCLSQQTEGRTVHWDTSVGATTGQEQFTEPRWQGSGHEASMGEIKGDGNVGGRWAGEQGPRGEEHREARQEGWGSLGCYERREPPRIWGNAPAGRGQGRREANGEESGRPAMHGGLALRGVGVDRTYTGREGRPDGWEPRQSEGWRGGNHSTPQCEWQGPTGSRHLGPKGDQGGWQSLRGGGNDGLGIPGQGQRDQWRRGHHGVEWVGFQGPPGTHHGGQRRPEAYHGLCWMCGTELAKRGPPHGEEWWSGLTQHGDKRVAEAVHGPHWMRGDGQAESGQAHREAWRTDGTQDGDKRGAGALHGPRGIRVDEQAKRGQAHGGEWRSDRAQHGDKSGPKASHGPRCTFGGGQDGTGQEHGKQWWIDPEGYFGVRGPRGGKDGGKTDKEEWLRGNRVDGLGKNVQDRSEAGQGMSNNAGWCGGQQLRGVKHGGTGAKHSVWQNLRGPDGEQESYTAPLPGEEQREVRDWPGPREWQGSRREQHERNVGGHQRWHGMVGFVIDRQGGTGGGPERGQGWIGGNGGAPRDRGQDLRTSVGVQHMEGPMPRQQWVGGRADQRWCGEMALQAGSSLRPRGGGQALNRDGGRLRAGYQEGKPNGSEPERPKRDRAEAVGAADHGREKGKKQRVGDGKKSEGIGRKATTGQENGDGRCSLRTTSGSSSR